jgi:hypothetical protein
VTSVKLRSRNQLDKDAFDTASSRRRTLATTGTPVLTATIRYGDLSDDSSGTWEYIVDSGPFGQFPWPQNTIGSGPGWTTGAISFAMDCYPGGGANNVSMSVAGFAVGGSGNAVYNVLSGVLFKATATPSSGQLHWKVSLSDLQVTFYPAAGSGQTNSCSPVEAGTDSKQTTPPIHVRATNSAFVDVPSGFDAVRVRIHGTISFTNATGATLPANALMGQMILYER